jgi:hypothetical protein
MRTHPYLRAYMAGIVVPTLFLLAVATIYAIFRFQNGRPVYLEVPSQFVFGIPGRPLERLIVFPMAIVPNLWGVWNMVHLRLRGRLPISLAAFGALLPLLLVPFIVTLGRALDVFYVQMGFALSAIPVGMALYYLAWKFLVGSLNEEMGIA